MSIPNTPSPLASVIAAKTYNANWFSGATKEAQITNAISSAFMDGALYVYVPANMLPYNASLVTFNAAIKMLAEGGSGEGFEVIAYGADSTGIIDASASFNACAQAAAGQIATAAPASQGSALIKLRGGVFKLENTVTTYRNGIEWEGEGERTTFLDMAPDTPKSLMLFANEVLTQPLSNCGFRNIGIVSSNNVQKTCLELLDCSDFRLDRWSIYYSATSTGLDTIGILWKGRELLKCTNFANYADRPFVFSVNSRGIISPNDIDIDFCSFEHGLVHAASTQYAFYFDPGLRSVQHPLFHDIAIVGGKGCFSWTGAGANRDSQGWVFSHIRSESMTGGATEWFVDFSRTNFNIIGPRFINCAPSFGNSGFKMRRVIDAKWDTIEWPDTIGTVKLFDIDTSNAKMKMESIWTQAGGASNITLPLIYAITRKASVDLSHPIDAYYDQSTFGVSQFGNRMTWLAGSRINFPTDELLLVNDANDTVLGRIQPNGRFEFDNGVRIGPSGTILTLEMVYVPNLTPAVVNAGTFSTQTFTVTGLTTSDTITVNPPAVANGLILAGFRVSAADTLELRWYNPTGGNLTPTAGVYRIRAGRN